MFGEKAVELVKEVNRNKDSLSPYNTDLIEQVNKEICGLIEQNMEDANASIAGSSNTAAYIPTVNVRHLSVQRNLRCLLSYHHNRVRCLRNMRWEFGSLLPPEIKSNLSSSEAAWFSSYSTSLAKYMRSIGDDGGVNLGADMKPPKSLYIEVRCLLDYGKHQLGDGTVILLKKNTRYYLPRTDCEELIRLEIFEHLIN
ncbi:PREDICTED: DNA replication complex GINS protein PSF1-like [Nicrophorus vespilloides]|uniref:DNA replication complex GINS protein PSF1 n=1 Tax=Nicrophorus vespilloides TaxID=110193 RepID=A0ABM1MIG9_NICVS|nr:PREDICTED: DNA replication complex GINS protein PSF1-like [Nicrophorus vespilloides]